MAQVVQQQQQQQQKERHVLAERYKTKMCRNFLSTGACPYETRCMFAHGDIELRTTEMNLRDGLITEEAIKAYQRAINLKNRAAAAAAAVMPMPPALPSSCGTDQMMQPQQPAASYPCYCDECVQHYYQHNPYSGAYASSYYEPQPAADYYSTEACQCEECLAMYAAAEAAAESAPQKYAAPEAGEEKPQLP